MQRLQDGENTTWRVWPTRGRKQLVLRLHRAGYQSPRRIEGELAWLEALGRDEPGIAPLPARSRDGRWLHEVELPATRVVRPATLLRWTEGRFTPWPGSPNALTQLGTLAAKLHRHARTWRSSAKTRRPLLGFEEQVGRACHWGVAPLDVPGLRKPQRDLLAGTIRTLRARIAAWDRRSGTRGLIHADLHLGNVLLADGVARAIDFDDCVRTWFLMDPAVTLLSAALREGYARRRDAFWSAYAAEGGVIPSSDQEMLPTFHLMRMITMFAWSWSRCDHPQLRAYHAVRQKLMLAACRVWNRTQGTRIR